MWQKFVTDRQTHKGKTVNAPLGYCFDCQTKYEGLWGGKEILYWLSLYCCLCDYVKLSLFILAWAYQLWWGIVLLDIFTIFLSFQAVASSWSCCICKVSPLLRSGFLNSGGKPSESHFMVPQLNIPLWRRVRTKEMDVKNLKLCQKYDIWCNTYTFNMKCSGKEYISIFVSQIVVFITNLSKNTWWPLYFRGLHRCLTTLSPNDLPWNMSCFPMYGQ